MTDKQTRKLTRTDLLELLMSEEQENERLRERIGELERSINSVELELSKLGSLTESLEYIRAMFEAADDEVTDYLVGLRDSLREKPPEAPPQPPETPEAVCAEETLGAAPEPAAEPEKPNDVRPETPDENEGAEEPSDWRFSPFGDIFEPYDWEPDGETLKAKAEKAKRIGFKWWLGLRVSLYSSGGRRQKST